MLPLVGRWRGAPSSGFWLDGGELYLGTAPPAASKLPLVGRWRGAPSSGFWLEGKELYLGTAPPAASMLPLVGRWRGAPSSGFWLDGGEPPSRGGGGGVSSSRDSPRYSNLIRFGFGLKKKLLHDIIICCRKTWPQGSFHFYSVHRVPTAQGIRTHVL